MAFVTMLRQVSQVRNSGNYNDTIPPTEAAFETSPTELETDLNNIRSYLSELRDVRAGNWWDALAAPSALGETGSARGVQNLNDALFLLEKQRRLRRVKLLADVAVPAAVQATETLTTTAQPGNNETVTIGGQTYTYKTTLTPAANEVLIGASQTTAMENLRRAINDDGVADTNYGAGTVANAFVTATDTPTTVVVTAIKAGTAGNGIAVTETLGNGSWGAATLSGGAGDLVILDTGEIPTGSGGTQAVGAVTTLGTVVAHSNTFGTEATLDEVAGAHALAPKNLIEIVNGSTGDPILTTGGRRIWALMQSEDATDGATITNAAGSSSVQLVFVAGNTTNDDLEIIDGADIGGTTINYCYTERVRHEDLNEQDYLNSAAVDIGAGAVSVTRQAAYDNQGVTPVSLTNNADLDIGAGLTWTLADATSAPVFQMVEGSTGGTTTFWVRNSVDVYNNDAASNDFQNGATFSSSDTRPIHVGATDLIGTDDGVIQSTAGDLEVRATNEVIFNDTHMANEGTWARTGVLLADSAAEVTAYDTAFGEVSLFAAIVAANNSNTTRQIARSTVTAASISAGTNVTGGAGANTSGVLIDYTSANNQQDFEDTPLMDVYVNGVLLAPDFTSGADYNPGDDVTEGDLKFNAILYLNDRITMVTWF